MLAAKLSENRGNDSIFNDDNDKAGSFCSVSMCLFSQTVVVVAMFFLAFAKKKCVHKTKQYCNKFLPKKGI